MFTKTLTFLVRKKLKPMPLAYGCFLPLVLKANTKATPKAKSKAIPKAKP